MFPVKKKPAAKTESRIDESTPQKVKYITAKASVAYLTSNQHYAINMQSFSFAQHVIAYWCASVSKNGIFSDFGRLIFALDVVNSI